MWNVVMYILWTYINVIILFESRGIYYSMLLVYIYFRYILQLVANFVMAWCVVVLPYRRKWPHPS